MSNSVKAQAKDNKVFVEYHKDGKYIEALIRFTDQYGIERATILRDIATPDVTSAIQRVMDGEANIVAPSSAEEGVRNVYDSKP